MVSLIKLRCHYRRVQTEWYFCDLALTDTFDMSGGHWLAGDCRLDGRVRLMVVVGNQMAEH
jgi:hypothetical protein